MKNWQEAEAEFEARFRSFGKRAYVHKLPDTKSVRHYTKGKGFVVAQPSDYIVTHDGAMFYGEVKFCTSKTSFPFGSIQTGQMNAARRIIAAGGWYFFFIYSVASSCWFRVPAAMVIVSDKKSLKWSEIQNLKWNL